ncbi:hypothetical protein CLOACE_14920 [Clostridium acetireducens DSM 10703]|uniref:SLAP domain-containing protein n=1 Tax=Clostridium acetireducens DSM 10703 TaxID=1121290 RepID=A0A1E8EY49_9CLOT|nr:SLAP domain-containing protein [Clostridium acetireducens]OFI05874.1 hypothetical protein CLOACE_14920 [Clostridium acetireducens DSM 10703]
MSNSKRREVKTELSLLGKYNDIISDVHKQVLEEEISQLPPIKEGEVSVHGVYAYDTGEYIEVKVYIRNGLNKNINFTEVPFLLLNNKNEVLARETFNLEKVGLVPAGGARPYKLNFHKDNLLVDKIPIDDWKITFDKEVQATTYVSVEYENLPENMPEESKKVYYEFLNNLSPLKQGDITLDRFSIGINKEGNILVTIVIRNGSNKHISVEEIPVTVTDKNNILMASNVFKMDNLSILPCKARICHFVFPMDVKLDRDMDLSDWKVYFEAANKNNTENIYK